MSANLENTGNMTGKIRFLLQSQRRAMSKNVWTTIQLSSLHILIKLWSKSFKWGFISTWTENFQMYKLDLEKQRNQTSNCQHPLHQRESKVIQKNIYFFFIDDTEVFDHVDHNILGNILKEMGVLDHLTSLLRNLYVGQETTVRILHG